MQHWVLMYCLAGQTTITATAQALVAGANFNVTAGQLSQLGTQVAGISTVTNPNPINNGLNAQSDTAFRAAFVSFLASLAQATESAILSAALQVQQGITVNLLENTNSLDQPQVGTFTAVVNNGTGSPPSSLLTNVFNAVFAARAFTVQPFVIGPVAVPAVIALAVRVASGFVSASVTTAVQNAVVSFVQTLGEGATLFISQIEAAALAVPGVVSVKPANTTINGLQADLTCTGIQTISTSISAVTVGTY